MNHCVPAVCRGERPIEKLEAALDALYDHNQPFFDRYHLLSGIERRVGGQGLVQFARVRGAAPGRGASDMVRAVSLKRCHWHMHSC